MAYSDKVIDHYENPRNVGSFEKGDETVGTGMHRIVLVRAWAACRNRDLADRHDTKRTPRRVDRRGVDERALALLRR